MLFKIKQIKSKSNTDVEWKQKAKVDLVSNIPIASAHGMSSCIHKYMVLKNVYLQQA